MNTCIILFVFTIDIHNVKIMKRTYEYRLICEHNISFDVFNSSSSFIMHIAHSAHNMHIYISITGNKRPRSKQWIIWDIFSQPPKVWTKLLLKIGGENFKNDLLFCNNIYANKDTLWLKVVSFQAKSIGPHFILIGTPGMGRNLLLLWNFIVKPPSLHCTYFMSGPYTNLCT